MIMAEAKSRSSILLAIFATFSGEEEGERKRRCAGAEVARSKSVCTIA